MDVHIQGLSLTRNQVIQNFEFIPSSNGLNVILVCANANARLNERISNDIEK